MTSVELDKIFTKFINDIISLNRSDIENAVKSREWFLNGIKNKIESEERNNEPFLYKEKPFVKFGSYFKGTKVSTVDEFDILVVIDSNSGVFRKEGGVIGNGLGNVSPNPKYYQKYYKDDLSGVSPVKMLNWLKSVIDDVISPYGGETPIRNGQAITAIIKSKNLKIDFVPAGVFKKNDDKLFYNIPDGTKNGGWTLTNPETDIALINYIASQNNDFKNIIRVIKYIRDNYSLNISSFAIECVAVDYTIGSDRKWSSSSYINLIKVLLHLSEKFKYKNIYDINDVSVNLLDDLDADISKWYSGRIVNIVNELLKISDYTDFDKSYTKFNNILSNK